MHVQLEMKSCTLIKYDGIKNMIEIIEIEVGWGAGHGILYT